MSRASMLYLLRKKRVAGKLWPRPTFTTNSLHTHFRPHVVLPDLRDVENPGARLAVVPLEQVPAHVRNEDDS
jgi:hypothetical protein